MSRSQGVCRTIARSRSISSPTACSSEKRPASYSTRRPAPSCRTSSIWSTNSRCLRRSWRLTATGGTRSRAPSGTSPAMRWPFMQKVQWMTPKPALSNSSIEAGELAEQRGEYLEAAGAYETALDDPDPLVVAMAHNCLGKLAWQQGQYDASYAAFEKARSIATRHDNLDARARAEIGLG